MTAEEAFKRLKRCINIDHYIGSRDRLVIEEACKDKPKPVAKPVAKVKKVKASEA